MRKPTLCLHTPGENRDSGLVNPILPSTAYPYMDSPEIVYPRYFNTDNQLRVAERLAALEGADQALLFSSGMAAITTTLLALAGPGDQVVIQEGVYGGTLGFCARELTRLGIRVEFCPGTPEGFSAAITDHTRVVLAESPTNPLLDLVDLRELAARAGARGVVTVVDNTFATPVNQNPLALGIDLVLHSGTKYLGGHSDLSCGVVAGGGALMDRVMQKARFYGGNLNALDVYLLDRSLKTLALRVECQNRNAEVLARFLAAHPGVARVLYPGLHDHPGHALATRQMTGFGGMFSFELKDESRSLPFLRALSLIMPAVSLGGVDTTICQPCATSHGMLPAEERRRMGIGDALLRLSAGIEHPDDLVEDLDRALGA
jgi:cystathionine beta-lyase/cystathionine gamma-synthase